MEANEILNNEELINDVEVIDSLPETNNVAVKAAIGVGAIIAAGVLTTVLYKKHKNKAEDGDDCKKRKFTLLKGKNNESDEEELLEGEVDKNN